MISGLAVVYYRDGDPGTEYKLPWGDVERIKRGAFDDVLGGADVAALVNHEPNQILGRTSAGTLRLTDTPDGLRYDVDPPDTQLGRDTAVSIARGDIRGSSFGFNVDAKDITIERDDSGRMVNWITRVSELFDVGPVTFPAYKGTTAFMRAMSRRDDYLLAINRRRHARACRVMRLAVLTD